MINFQFFKIPEEITSLLRVDFNKVNNKPDFIEKYILSSPTLKVYFKIIQRSHPKLSSHEFNFSDSLQALDLDEVIISISSIYIYHFTYKMLPQEYPSDIADEIQEINKFLEEFYPSGMNRGFLFSIYLKFLITHVGMNKNKEIDRYLSFPIEAFELIKLNKLNKSPNIDYILMIVWHIVSFFGFEKARFILLEQKFTFNEVYLSFNEDQKELIISNLKNYIHSIGEEEQFFF